ncbi:MAG: hypothetical protein A3C79_00735 [Candidatus Taylorbacteria bacterium RIFCSPHIGHO2_02_FULL_45_28]|uniref:Uncharacterized protein n=1 Tax=Candidatus Taylorbacteria bacterium RIFCSPHIGHO2_12_FULL_45_16 TaxID=1802315 RepID=A0A1G2MZH7_9BACT|nr:MAG: hypothetical protein A2830_01990 [Candidatus Taylorbacteria bacterium RIFCSPHIGHO2_01_FULL_44_110]OHA25546.1 MAG: hypothetical protein A3C79_00735 [Candidatus Taylorbacteria bacterium RIFCSPHIGHO2_02_FULL_45_28]OHA29213.1 MAG: hypothetical protein A3F51_01200 [Candidatus Taylorbacteria bacterium RIFCSPHIGHO2_12_FULL_45_16]OHA33435.1 MAG: hypothetical protein A3A23_02080 [Candidatus Taylorbacteria bacterium RIFCSPLOWO2_01_FULL_45_59]OHA39234.1 MAG: hypothetical protein A3I98_02205 [Candi
MKPEEFNRYIDNQLRQGIPRQVLTANLRAGGWNQEQIDQALIQHDRRIHKELLSARRHTYSLREKVLIAILLIVMVYAGLFHLSFISLDYRSVIDKIVGVYDAYKKTGNTPPSSLAPVQSSQISTVFGIE